MKFQKSPRIWLAIVIVAVLVLIALWPDTRLVDSGIAERGSVRTSVDAEGRTRVIDRYEITSPVAAMARRLTLHPGDVIEAGQAVVVLDAVTSTPLDRRERERAEAAVGAARARLAAAGQQVQAATVAAERAQADATRAATLAGQGLIAAAVAEQAATERELAQRSLASARFAQASAAHELELAQAALRLDAPEAVGEPVLTVHSPVAGVLLRRHFESARPVQPGQALIEIGDPGRLEAEIEVLSADAVRLREGMRVELLRWGERDPLPGRVRRIEPGGYTKFSALGVEEQRVWVIVELTGPVEQWRRLGDAYRVHARFVLREVTDGLRVPTSAVFREGEGRAVFRIDQGRAHLTPVTVGIEGEGYSEVLDGLDDGARVIVHPDRLIEDGDRVRMR